jgi:16S rRNA (cytosine1402-N4)-methyltransferase
MAHGRALAEKHGGRLTLIAGPFGYMERLIHPFSPGPIAGIAFDLGVSSMQIDEAERGFSFRQNGPLDMRMSREGEGAAELIARLSERELADLIRALGEERFAGRIARAIVAAQRRQPLATTSELAEIVHAAIPRQGARHETGLDPATRTFQALRIAVNDELGELDRGLAAAEHLLMPGGRLAVVSFHSLEDARVKSFLRRRSEEMRGSRHLPPRPGGPTPSFIVHTRRPVRSGPEEIARNPRARSARLRSAERSSAAPSGLFS